MLILLLLIGGFVAYGLMLSIIRRQYAPTAKNVAYSRSFKIIYYIFMAAMTACFIGCAYLTYSGKNAGAEFAILALMPFILLTGQAVMEVAHGLAENQKK